MEQLEPQETVGQSFYAPSYNQTTSPPLPPRPVKGEIKDKIQTLPYDVYSPPPRLRSMEFKNNIEHSLYVRDPHRLIAYLVPFPKPQILNGDQLPDRFMIYTPPAPPIPAPKEGEKEEKIQKLQRKWQQEIREAKLSDAKVTSWKGAKSRALKGINAAMDWTTTSNLDFLNRVPVGSNGKNRSADTSDDEDATMTDKTLGLEEMALIYPASMPGSVQQIREEFVLNMLRSKSKAQKDTVIATGLLPVSFAIDVLATLVWPFGGLLEIDAVWAYSSFRGAKTARSVTKRLHSSSPTNEEHDKHTIKLSFTPSVQLEVLRRYLVAECHKRNPKLFASEGPAPIESHILETIGWTPSQSEAETRNWEDEQWEIAEVKDDLRTTMQKGAKEWEKWCKDFEKNPEKALKK